VTRAQARSGSEVEHLLTAALHQQRLTPAKVAELVGYSEAAVRRWVSGKVTPQDAHAYALIDQLGLDVAVFMAAVAADRDRRRRFRPPDGKVVAIIAAVVGIGGISGLNPAHQLRASRPVPCPCARSTTVGTTVGTLNKKKRGLVFARQGRGGRRR
jgi:transcriptional regulator with XRE-family HTH domain